MDLPIFCGAGPRGQSDRRSLPFVCSARLFKGRRRAFPPPTRVVPTQARVWHREWSTPWPGGRYGALFVVVRGEAENVAAEPI